MPRRPYGTGMAFVSLLIRDNRETVGGCFLRDRPVSGSVKSGETEIRSPGRTAEFMFAGTKDKGKRPDCPGSGRNI